MTTNEKIEKLAKVLAKICECNFDCLDTINGDPDKSLWRKLARHVLTSELEAEIKGLCFCHPDLRSESGITVQLQSTKHFALKRKIELEQQLLEIRS